MDVCQAYVTAPGPAGEDCIYTCGKPGHNTITNQIMDELGLPSLLFPPTTLTVCKEHYDQISADRAEK